MAIKIIGLGPGNAMQMTREAWQSLTSAETVYLRTERHPAVADFPANITIKSFDHLYDTTDSFEELYARIVQELLARCQDEEIVYVVPGHPYVGEATVTALVAAARERAVPVSVLGGPSFVEPVLTSIGEDALDGLQLFDALALLEYHYPPVNADSPMLLAQVFSPLVASDLKVVLGAIYPDQHPVTLIHAAGTQGEIVESLSLYEIDRSRHIDHLTSLFVPPLPQKATLAALAETVAVLRSPDGCPWDQEQTAGSMRAGLLEETSEVVDAISAGDPIGLREELGDVLYHLVMQAQMALETGEFRLSEVVAGIEAKLRHRHPHVWGDWEVRNTAEVLHNWEILKNHEKPDRGESLLDGIPNALPALARSQKIQSKVRKVGFDWPDVEGVYTKLEEEIAEIKAARSHAEIQGELGDALFVMANVANWLDVDAESALRSANQRFSHRFRRLEQLIGERGLEWSELDWEGLDGLWEEVKERLAKEE